MIKLAVFDMDGTILDTLEDLQDSLNEILRRHGYPERTYEEVRSFVGNGIRRLIRLAVPESVTEAEVDSLLQEYLPYYQAHCAEKTKPYDGIPQLLQRLRQAGVLTAVVSNKADAAVQKLCEDFFEGCFDAAAGETADARRKPAPDLVNKVLDMLCVTDRSEAVYIGDSEVDKATAENSELRFIGVDWGFRGRAFLESLGAERIADRPEDVDEFIRRM